MFTYMLRVRRNFVAKTQGVRKYVSRCCCSVDHHRAEVFDGSSGRGGSGSGRGRGRRLSRATPEVVAMAVASAIGEEGDAIHFDTIHDAAAAEAVQFENRPTLHCETPPERPLQPYHARCNV